uniref:Uncharacterized protein n=1 Tax=Arion vulgaris TaxID=1028688 RepID=A0A0B6ZHX4_9EUPU
MAEFMRVKEMQHTIIILFMLFTTLLTKFKTRHQILREHGYDEEQTRFVTDLNIM